MADAPMATADDLIALWRIKYVKNAGAEPPSLVALWNRPKWMKAKRAPPESPEPRAIGQREEG